MPAPVAITTVHDEVKRAETYFQIGWNEVASAIADKLHEIAPTNLWAQVTYANSKIRKGETAEAINILRSTITNAVNMMRHPNAPVDEVRGLQENLYMWHTMLAGWLLSDGHLREALQHAKSGIKPEFAESSRARVVLSRALWENGDIEAALRMNASAIAADPKNPEAHLHMSEILLCKGDWRAAWSEYEWRNDMPIAGSLPWQCGESHHWSGYQLGNDTELVVIGDQGYGDTILFARYLPMAAKAFPAGVYLGVAKETAGLMKRSFAHCIKGIGSQHHEVPAHTVHCRITSLPWALGEIDAPQWPGVYLKPDPVRVASWRARVAGDKPVIGLAWSGRPTHPNNARRSTTLRTFAPLFDVPGIRFVSIQKPFPEQDKVLAHKLGLEDWSGDLVDYDETAALVQCLDAVVSVDTSVVHLAGALGRPCFVITPHHVDWRWQNGGKSLWYPSVQAFRQHAPCQWDGVMEEVANMLRTDMPRACAMAAD